MASNRDKLAQFATRDRPIRVSSVPSLMRCPARSVILYLDLAGDTSGGAAHSGSYFHAVVDAWHTAAGDASVDAAIRVAAARRHEWPDADERFVIDAARGYCRDPRNRVALVASEAEVTFSIDPSPDDPTGSPIWFLGHVDQVRAASPGDVDTTPRVWDMKLSRKGGVDLVNAYLYQLVLYSVGASSLLKRTILPGGIIRASSYATKEAVKLDAPPGVFFPLWHGVDAAQVAILVESLTRGVAKQVAAIRRGDFDPRPGDWCGYCPVGSLARCVPLTSEVTK